jgi:hypothetical protein
MLHPAGSGGGAATGGGPICGRSKPEYISEVLKNKNWPESFNFSHSTCVTMEFSFIVFVVSCRNYSAIRPPT